MQNDIKAQAQQLRDQGYSLRETAEKIGKHYSWVSRNTTATPRNTRTIESIATSKREIAVAQALAKATSPQGCNVSEFNAIIKDTFGTVWDEEAKRFVVDCDSKARKSIKRSVQTAAERDGKIALFFEDFLDRQNPLASNGLMLTLAQDLHERVELLVSEYRDEYPDITVFAIQSALVRLAIPGYKQEGVESFCERNAAAAQALQQVAPEAAPIEIVTQHTDEFLADLADIDADAFGCAEAPAAHSIVTHEEYREDVAVFAVEKRDDEPVSLDDFDDDEALINYDSVDTDWMDQDDHFYPNPDRQTAIRKVWSGSKAAQFGKRTEVKRPHDWALQQQLEDAAFMAAALDASQDDSFLF